MTERPAMDDAAGRAEATEGMGDLEPPLWSAAEGKGDQDATNESGEGVPSRADVPNAAAGSGSGDATATGGVTGGATGNSDLAHPLG
ncbi:MAG: hypothetical protein M3Q27_16700 [Actinomycetota bacterium]|nr:hypothetical protein [Actinomycetota bacterium]